MRYQLRQSSISLDRIHPIFTFVKPFPVRKRKILKKGTERRDQGIAPYAEGRSGPPRRDDHWSSASAFSLRRRRHPPISREVDAGWGVILSSAKDLAPGAGLVSPRAAIDPAWRRRDPSSAKAPQDDGEGERRGRRGAIRGSRPTRRTDRKEPRAADDGPAALGKVGENLICYESI